MITIQEIIKMSKLSKLRFNEQEIDTLTMQINEVMNMINELNEVNGGVTQGSLDILQQKQPLREDEAIANENSYGIFDNVQGDLAELSKEIKCFITPKVIE